jgi:hypothetical protein
MMTAFAQNSKQSTIVLPSDFSQTASMFDQMLAANKATGSEPNGLDVK